MPGKAYRSKLRPFLDFIREERAQEKTWEEIASAIIAQGVPTDRSQVCKFFMRSEKGKTPAGFRPAISQASTHPLPSPTPTTVKPSPGQTPSLDPEEEFPGETATAPEPQRGLKLNFPQKTK